MTKRDIKDLNSSRHSDMEVMYSFHKKHNTSERPLGFARWLTSISPSTFFVFCMIIALYPMLAFGKATSDLETPFNVLVRWLPLLLIDGFGLNILISFLTMVFGTIAGIILGLMLISPNRALSLFANFNVQIFRNSPWLVILFIVMLSFPNEIEILDRVIVFPDWVKAILGLTLPVMANVAEIVRGAIQAIPTGQWEASEAMGYNRHQILWHIILPQCIKSMIPPWMNWYAILTMSTPIVSLLGVGEMVTTTRLAMAAENDRPDLLFPFFGFCLITFFIYCYPIARWTMRLERRYAVKF